MFKKILIANRGEIACRVIRACREMRSARSPFIPNPTVTLHQGWRTGYLGPAASAESYLRGDKIIEVGRRSGAEAIHPGYGFRSENGEFVRQVTAAGLAFIGPPPEAMEAMGGKISARIIATEAGVPVVPGTNEPVTSHEKAMEIAREIGFPVMLKASAGGGGKGMRLVADESELRSALDAARSEAMASFGDESVFVEKAVVRRGTMRYRSFQIRTATISTSANASARFSGGTKGDRRGSVADKFGRAQTANGRVCRNGRPGGQLRRGRTVEFLVSDVDRSFYFSK